MDEFFSVYQFFVDGSQEKTDSLDCTNAEWIYGKGIVFPVQEGDQNVKAG